ncbi:ARC6/PARC6 family protein [Pleurocapsales cyanobacterium LEGE 06147]|nr:ARC6/PARC6 family protein [Pleurocapsales cyanobacterium LEGE 06147]
MNKLSNCLKKIQFFIFIFILILSGCSKPKQLSSQNESNLADTGCPEEPKLKLDKKNIEDISLTNQTVNKSNRVSSNKAIGYTFQAEAGQKLSYQTDEDICIWVYDPNNQLVNRTKLPETGKYVIQVAAPKGSKTFDLEMSLETFTSNAASTPPISNTNESNNSTSQTASRQFDLTKEQALEIVAGWYRAKPKIFGYPFDESLVAQYTTGQMYYEKLEKDGGGSVGWLRSNGCYYTYDFSNIDNVWLFSTSGTRPLLKIKVSEKLQLHGPSSAGCGNRPQYYQKNVNYWFEKDNGVWKIYYYEIQ